MRIDRYVHDERLTWGAAGVLLAVAALHAGGILRLLLAPPEMPAPEPPPPPVFEISLQKLPPPQLEPRREPETVDMTGPIEETVRKPPRQTRPVPILVDTPTSNPVPVGTQVKAYEIGDEALPGVPGPPVVGGTPDGEGFDSSPGPRGPVLTKVKLLEYSKPAYPPSCLRQEIEGRVKVRVLVGENGRPQEATVAVTSGNSTLDEAALGAVRRWRFAAATKDGVPVRAWIVIPVEFKLID